MPQYGNFTNADGLKIHTVKWLPQGYPYGVVIIVHGIGEHSGRYDHVALILNKHGYAVYGLDHRGHGRSEGLRLHFDNFDQPVSDLQQFIAQICAEQPEQPLFMYGHSMGSAISLRYVLKHQSELAGWICSGTTLFLDKSVAQPIVVAASAMARVLPKFRLVPFSSKHLSRDPDVVAAYDTDPLVDHKPLRLQILKGMIRSGQQARPQLETIKLPVLILHGTADKVVPVAGSQYLYEHIGSQDKTLKLYEGLFHEIHNEPEQKMVLDDVVQWLNRQRPAKLKVIRRNP